MNNQIDKAFSGWKVFAAVTIGLLISGWMFYSSLNAVQFIEVEKGSGTHEWIDGNDNGQIDLKEEADFKLASNGNYELKTVSSTLSDVSWTSTTYWWLFAALLFTAGRDFFYMVRIRLLTNNKLKWKASFYVIMLWEFASALSPGVVGGSAVAMFILNREGVPFGKATAIVIITAFMDNLFYVVMIPLVFLFISHADLFPAGETSTAVLMWWFWIGFSIIFTVCLFLYLTIFWYPQLATRFLLLLFKLPFLRRWKVVAMEWGKDIEKASKEFKSATRGYWFKVFFATFGSWISRYLVINAILNAFIALNLIDNFRILGKQLVLWLFMLVSPTPGGSGVAEYAFGELLSSFGASAILLAVMALIWRMISYFPYLFIGSILLPNWIKRTKG